MTKILDICASILWFVQRWFTNKDNPKNIQTKQKEQNEIAIVKGDEPAVNAELDRTLDRL